MTSRGSDYSAMKRPEPTNFRMADYRRDLHLKHKREQHARREKLRSIHENRFLSKNAVTIDTSRGRNNMDVLRLCIKELYFKEYPFGRREQCCDVHWHAGSFEENQDLYGGAVNKFPGMSEILSKMSLFRSLDQMREIFPDEYNFYPRTWYLPGQFHQFCSEVRQLQEKKVKPKPTYIVKPDKGAQGDGIYLLRDPQEYSSLNGKCHVAQEYISNVYLINNYKFDLRVYVLLQSMDPLKIYICKEGLARFSTVPYETPTNKNLHETFMHLTNYSLNKRSSTFNRSEREDEGSKRTLTSVFRRIGGNCHDTDLLWTNIERLVCKTIIAVMPDLKVEYQATVPPHRNIRCFQILGFDILLLNDLTPYLLEVNACPSLSLDGEQEVSPGVFEYVTNLVDELVKRPLVRDSLLLMVPPAKLKYCCRRNRKRKKKKPPEEKGTRNYRVPTMHQRTHIVIIKADESDEEKREVDVTQQMMSDMTVERPDSTVESHPEDETDENNEDANENESEISAEIERELERREKESCLKQLFPAIYDQDYEPLRLLERVASMFISSIGVRGTQRIGPTGFRTFARKSRLCKKGITNAAIDIMYIDMQRRWDHLIPERTSVLEKIPESRKRGRYHDPLTSPLTRQKTMSNMANVEKKSKNVGLCYQGFLDACLEIARRKFYAATKLEMLQNMVDYCESHLYVREDEPRDLPNLPRLHSRKLSSLMYRPMNTPHYMMPKRTIESMTEETIENLYSVDRKTRMNSAEEVQAFLRQRRRTLYVPNPSQFVDKRSLTNLSQE